MPCLAVVLAFISPRLALVALWLFSDILSRSMDGSWLLPLIGFFILPWTTLAWGVMWDLGTNEVAGFELLVVAMAFLVDLGSYFGGKRYRDVSA